MRVCVIGGMSLVPFHQNKIRVHKVLSALNDINRIRVLACGNVGVVNVSAEVWARSVTPQARVVTFNVDWSSDVKAALDDFRPDLVVIFPDPLIMKYARTITKLGYNVIKVAR